MHYFLFHYQSIGQSKVTRNITHCPVPLHLRPSEVVRPLKQKQLCVSFPSTMPRRNGKAKQPLRVLCHPTTPSTKTLNAIKQTASYLLGLFPSVICPSCEYTNDLCLWGIILLHMSLLFLFLLFSQSTQFYGIPRLRPASGGGE